MLLIAITIFDDSDKNLLKRSIYLKILSNPVIPLDSLILPGHHDVFTKQEKIIDLILGDQWDEKLGIIYAPQEYQWWVDRL